MNNAPPLLYLKNVEVHFGGKPLFTDLSMSLYPDDKVCLVGKNGCGKTTLFKLISHELEADKGEYFIQPGKEVGYLPQQVITGQPISLYDYVLDNLDIPEGELRESFYYRADMVLNPLELNGPDSMERLSGGQYRRASLAKALIQEPDILLLDEPTNHLDLAAITWLEGFLRTYHGAVLCISHDREFLRNISTKTFWLDRGVMRVNYKGYADFENWSDELIEQEARQLANLGRKMQVEEGWMQGGISARRKRNVQRVEKLVQMRQQLRDDKTRLRQVLNKVELPALTADMSAKLVFEIKNVVKSFTDANGKIKPIVDGLSTRIMRKDKIGIIGNNGTGKTTFLQMLTGNLEPDSGRIRTAKNADIRYIDQHRLLLDSQKSLIEVLCPHGGDHVNVNGHLMHVIGYLKKFMFNKDEARGMVSTLSGGQMNRLLLAKQLADPGNVLILDEPTNDLDMDTLDLLQELLDEYDGTLIIVSHDRDFIDRIVNRTLVFEGNGVVEGYIGGYTDYLNYKKRFPKNGKESLTDPNLRIENKPADNEPKLDPKVNKLSYKLKRELEILPAQIEQLSIDIKTIEEALADANLYLKDPEQFDKLSFDLSDKQHQLASSEERWLELEEMRLSTEN
ncbi:MAG: ABC-F family ATP-binding cassette domain-containing protein [Alphaproteobacteria bacterium]|nr:ABC-F family ATP-binding cassette domain-containing protein [Alphaproteobacteria bacterium]